MEGVSFHEDSISQMRNFFNKTRQMGAAEDNEIPTFPRPLFPFDGRAIMPLEDGGEYIYGHVADSPHPDMSAQKYRDHYAPLMWQGLRHIRSHTAMMPKTLKTIKDLLIWQNEPRQTLFTAEPGDSIDVREGFTNRLELEPETIEMYCPAVLLTFGLADGHRGPVWSLLIHVTRHRQLTVFSPHNNLVAGEMMASSYIQKWEDTAWVLNDHNLRTPNDVHIENFPVDDDWVSGLWVAGYIDHIFTLNKRSGAELSQAREGGMVKRWDNVFCRFLGVN